jgi:hypothetical protein
MSVLALCSGFVFVCVMLFFGVLYGSTLHWAFKAALISLVLVFTITVGTGYRNSLGYAVHAESSDGFRVLYAVISDPTTSTSGTIFLWVNPIGAPMRPRAISIAYSKANRDMVTGAQKKIHNGESVMMRLAPHRRRHTTLQGGGSSEEDDDDDSDGLDIIQPPDQVPTSK